MNAPRTQIRECWRVLAEQAQEKGLAIQGEINQIRQRMSGLEASRERLSNMYNDYMNPNFGLQGVTQGMQETHDARQFATQLLSLLDRVNQDLAQAQRGLIAAQERRIKAEQERLKMQALMEQDMSAVARYQQKREQALLDATGLMQFNLGANP